MKIGFDFDDTLTTTKGMNIAKLRRSQGHELFIVSARHEVSEEMKTKGAELGIAPSKIFATGSNLEKLKKVEALGLKLFYDNNPDVVKALNGYGIKSVKV